MQLFGHFRRALWKALGHNVLTMAKAAAYSAILSLFPALLVATTLLALSPETANFRGEIRSAFVEILPPDTMTLVQSYFQAQNSLSTKVLWSASSVSVFAALGVMLSLMEGFRRAYQLPRGEWNFWRERAIALMLIPFCLVPMVFATVLVAFGHQIEAWMIENADHELRTYVLIAWRVSRWCIALLTTVVVLAVIYHFGTPQKQHWKRVVPGAVLATATWFLTTLIFGWYVTRFANYTIVYGSLGAGIATLIWLYITSLSVLFGAEFNAQVFPKPAFEETVDEHFPAMLDENAVNQIDSAPAQAGKRASAR
jgi:membrane protein